MSRLPEIWPNPLAYLSRMQPQQPVLFFAPKVLQQVARGFRAGFGGQVTYALKANDSRAVIENLLEAGIDGFDVASPAEIAKVRAVSADVALHYNNPVRSPDEIAQARAAGVCSYAVDGLSELAKLKAAGLGREVEVSVRLRLPVAGAVYDFGEKFGEDPAGAVVLLREVAASGFRASMTFHPGTQCAEPAAWTAYIAACAQVAREAGVALERLNVGGGFAANREGEAPDLGAIFKAIDGAVVSEFGADGPQLLCEPGRALVAESHVLATRIKGLRECGAVFLNDGVYGSMGEGLNALGVSRRIRVLSPQGEERGGARRERTIYGPTCDSLDRLPGRYQLPETLEEGDFVLFEAMGAYSSATVTRFNGYGQTEIVTVQDLAVDGTG